MNERIKELAEHCDFYVGNEHYNESHEEKQRIWTEKFAELIIRKCLMLCDQVDLVGADDCIDNIKDYFEIEK